MKTHSWAAALPASPVYQARIFDSARPRRPAAAATVLGAAIGLLAVGCSASALPRHPPMDAPDAIRLMAQRARQIKTMASPCRVVLTRDDGRSVQLDGALAARPPDHLRLRAWKVSRPVFDLTLRPDGLWLYVANDSDTGLVAALDELTADRVGRAWGVLSAGFDADEWQVVAEDEASFHLASDQPNGGRIGCEVSRLDLTTRQCDVESSPGVPAVTLRMDRYRATDGFVWPRRIRLDSAGGSITVLADAPDFNNEPPPRAFEPPPRAVQKP